MNVIRKAALPKLLAWGKPCSVTSVNVQQRSNVLKAALVTIISYAVEGSWGIVLEQKFHLQGRHSDKNSFNYQFI